MTDNCSWCNASRVTGLKCPACGAIYAKAEAIRQHGRASLPNDEIVKGELLQRNPSDIINVKSIVVPLVADPVLEWKFCVGAIPVALMLGMVFHASSFGHFLQRTFLSMPVHEFGHAFTAWFCGYAAFPTIWKTLIADSRSIFMLLIVATVVIYVSFHAKCAQNRPIAYVGVGLLIFQLICTFLIGVKTAKALIAFGGDAGAMIFGTLLMSTFFFGKNTQLYRGSLRWGFLTIGAAAFVDTFSTWWRALTDADVIPYGEIEGVGLSDPSRLVETYGWTQTVLVHRYVGVGVSCLAALICVWIIGMREAQKTIRLQD